MVNPAEIVKAVGAHSLWKQRLLAAIKDGRCDVSPQQAEPDNLCEFGRWMYSLPADARSSEHFKKVQSLHASFHKEAAKVLRLATTGQAAEANKCVTTGGSYAKVSSELTVAMMGWKGALGA